MVQKVRPDHRNMRNISVREITAVIRKLCIEACTELPFDVRKALDHAVSEEKNPVAQDILNTIIENYKIAENKTVPICQDTGMACVFLEIGQDVHMTDGSLEDAVNEGVRQGYTEGCLRKSVVRDPIRRGNTGDNTPAMIYEKIVPGDHIKVTLAPKGFGSENMSAISMLKPAEGLEGVKGFIIETVKKAGPNPCPPVVVGVGIGGTFDKCAALAKKALLRPLDSHHPDPFYAYLEEELLMEINQLDIGPQGFGGRTTALGLNIETLPTHIAGLPVAVNINCHVARHVTEVI